MSELTKDARVQKEIKRLTGLLTKMDAKTKKMASSLISNAAFMAITLEDLQEQININGPVSEYKNGENQYGTKKSPEVDIYNTMIKNHASIMKQLTDLMPKEAAKEEDDGFDSFVMGRD